MADLIPVPQQTPTPVVVTRIPRKDTALDLLEHISFLMDRVFEVPGSKARFGINSLLLLMPGVGDLIASAISMLILFIGLHHYRVPRIVATRMILNTLVDSVISAIPVVGNLWDVWFKADTRNVNLLREYVARGDTDPTPSTWRHWLVVLSVLL